MNKIKIVIALIVGFIAFWVIGTIMDNRETEREEQMEQQKEQATAAANAKVESLLNQNDFAGARAAAQSISDGWDREKAIQRITSGEVGYLISEGDFYMASQIAVENKCENVYYDKVVPALIPIYNKYEAKGAIEALSYCVLPREDTRWGAISSLDLYGDAPYNSEVAVQAKINELEERKKTDKVCRYIIAKNDGEYIVDFIVSDSKDEKLNFVEADIHYYKDVTINGIKANVLYFYSRRAYGDDIIPFMKSIPSLRNEWYENITKLPLPKF